MKKTKYNLFASIFSLVSTMFLLVCILLAWYVTNEEATASGITGSTAIIDENSEGTVSEIYYFNVTDYKTVTGSKQYTISQECAGTKLSQVELGKYDALYKEACQLLMVIKLKEEGNYSISATTDASKYLASTIKDLNGNFILKAEDNSISSVISITYISPSEVTLNENVDSTYGINFPTSITTISTGKCFISEYTDDPSTTDDDDKIFNDDLTKTINIVDSSSTTQYLYILLDYNEEAIEDIYTKNIGNDALNGISEYDGDYITYACDFKFSVEKVQGGGE